MEKAMFKHRKMSKGREGENKIKHRLMKKKKIKKTINKT